MTSLVPLADSRLIRIAWSQVAALAMLVAMSDSGWADEGVEFFESRIRPVLVERCYECHNTVENAEAGLALDWRDGIRSTSEHGPVVVPGKPEESLLLKVIRHEVLDLEMPEGGPKLDRAVVNDFAKWIEMGAPDPRSAPPSAEELSQSTSWETILARRKQWWSFQPIQNPQPPNVSGVDHPIDRFIRARLPRELQPASRADRLTRIRRLAYALTGLPPETKDVDQFLADDSDLAFERLMEQYLGSPHFGERWARHWMDLIRYADSHGSEGDPLIPHAYQYRDYLIRAFNADVPYDQLVREHIAGDLLEHPRINPQLGINESAIGPAHFRFVFHGFAPTDALDEKVRFTDDQINVFSKAFLGLTVSCARCHDHKFDAISQQDYYALFGIFASCRPALRDVNLAKLRQTNSQEIAQRKLELRGLLAEAWLNSLDDLRQRLTRPDQSLQSRIEEAKQPEQLLHFWKRITVDRGEDESIEDAWLSVREQWQAEQADRDQPENQRRWDFTTAKDYDDWFAFGNGLPKRPSPPGEFAVNADGPIVQGVFPAGIMTHSISQQHRGFLASRRFDLDREYDAWILVAGGGQPSLRYVVENYPRDGTVYPIPTIDQENFHWQQLKLKYWTGDFIHFELATSQDAPLQNRNRDSSWFAVREVLLRNSGDPAPTQVRLEYLTPLFRDAQRAPTRRQEVVDLFCSALQRALSLWKSGEPNDAQALLIDASLPLLPNDLERLPAVKAQVEEIRRLQMEIPEPTRVPSVVEADAFDQPLFARGNHRQPMDPVRRRFLESIDGSPYQTNQSGRLQLARSVLHPDNPLTARVIANRIWHYLFGRGIVATPDNFGQLGEQPTHPELLDYLATRIKNQGWSIKDTIRFMLTSQTWQARSSPTMAAQDRDPENRRLSHANVVRLDAESIRDTLLAVSDQLDPSMFGPGIKANGDERRRSVYITSRRNSLDSFLQTFDAPVPFATIGRRDHTNVPSQSLTLMNDPFVITLARQWASLSSGEDDLRKQVVAMFRKALGRRPTSTEQTALVHYVHETRRAIKSQNARRTQLEQRIQQLESSIESILAPARQLMAKSGQATQSIAKPIAAWDFENGFQDQVGNLDATPYGNAKIENGRLVLDGKSYVATGPLHSDLGEKTLEAIVQLATLDQRGGGVITVQTTDGTQFDSIVFGEISPQHWIAGSDYFKRTEDFEGELETEALKKPTHVVVTYQSDGTIHFYRNGRRYGNPTRKGQLLEFDHGKSQVLFGLRHSDGQDGMLRGHLFSAKLYDRALSAEEVAACAGAVHVSEEQLLAAVPEHQRIEWSELRQRREQTEKELDALPEIAGPNEALARLAHAIFNLKEFIYLR